MDARKHAKKIEENALVPYRRIAVGGTTGVTSLMVKSTIVCFDGLEEQKMKSPHFIWVILHRLLLSHVLWEDGFLGSQKLALFVFCFDFAVED